MKTFILALIVFGLIIFVHEFGHYFLAKLSGVRVEEFSLGMGPKLISKQWGETLYSLRVFPLGGFCKMSGETPGEDEFPGEIKDPKRFDQKSVWARISVIIAGPIMNFVLAAFIFVMIFTFLGVPKDYTTSIGNVVADGPAAVAGLQVDDEIVQINGKPVETWSEMVKVIHDNPGKTLDLTIKRGDSAIDVQVTPYLDQQNNVGMIGIMPKTPVWEKIGLIEGIKEGVYHTYEFTVLTINGLLQLITGKLSTNEIAGPVGIVKMIDESARYGIVYLANLTALISISIGLFNLIPIPALDGSRLLFLLVEAVRGKPVNPAKENFVHLVGFFLLMLLMVLVTYKDVIKLLS